MFQVSEFEVCVQTDGSTSSKYFVVWEWEWIEGVQEHIIESEEEDSCEQHNWNLMTICDCDMELPPSTLPTQTHTVTFKCIGSVHHVMRQVILSEISQELRCGHVVEVTVHPEPENAYNAKAIAFLCHWKNKGQTIGYIVRECLDHVHEMLRQKRLLSVKLSWAKYLVCWSSSGPGFYAGITVNGTQT